MSWCHILYDIILFGLINLARGSTTRSLHFALNKHKRSPAAQMSQLLQCRSNVGTWMDCLAYWTYCCIVYYCTCVLCTNNKLYWINTTPWKNVEIEQIWSSINTRWLKVSQPHYLVKILVELRKLKIFKQRTQLETYQEQKCVWHEFGFEQAKYNNSLDML